MPVSTHEELVQKACALFDGEIIASADYAATKERFFLTLREDPYVRKLPDTERWRAACELAWRGYQTASEPQKSWAKRLLDEDLKDMLLERLHPNGKLYDHLEAWPMTWPVAYRPQA